MGFPALSKRTYFTLAFGLGTVALAAVCSLLNASIGTFLLAWGALLAGYGLVSYAAKDT